MKGQVDIAETWSPAEGVSATVKTDFAHSIGLADGSDVSVTLMSAVNNNSSYETAFNTATSKWDNRLNSSRWVSWSEWNTGNSIY